MEAAPRPLQLDCQFEVQAQLGTGAGSDVHRVYDRLHGVQRALKIAYHPTQARAFQKEYRRLTELRHPHVVRAYDFGFAQDGRPYYTMELVRGVSLGAFADRGEPQVLAYVALQVLDALATVHARGFVHRDIKPANILLVGQRVAALARLIDFGLVAAAGKAARTAGTLPYIAPEIAREHSFDHRADLYSLGMVMYEALLPDAAPTSVEDVVRSYAHELNEPHRINPAIPIGLSRFIMRLLKTDPDERFLDAVHAARRLVELPDLPLPRQSVETISDHMLRGGAISHRRDALKKLRHWATQARQPGIPMLAAVDGPQGAGKTPFLRELAAQLNLAGFRVIRLRATRPGGSIMESLVRVATVDGAVSEAIDTERTAFAHQLGDRLAAVLADRPTVLIVDDMDRAESVAFEVVRQAAASRHLTIICGGDRGQQGAPWHKRLGEPLLQVGLERLSAPQIQELAAHRLQGLQLPSPALGRITRDSQGMPSLVERTLARLLLDQSIVRLGDTFLFVGGRYRAATHADSELNARLLDSIRLEAEPVLHAAAVLREPLPTRLLAAISGLPTIQIEQALVELTRHGLLRPAQADGEPSYLFRSRSLLQATYERISPARRARLHDAAAAALRLGQAAPELVTEHLLRGTDRAAAYDAALQAGERAATMHADTRAVDYYGQAYEQVDASDRRAGTAALRLAKIHERTGDFERALAWYERAARHDDAAIAANAELSMAWIQWVRGAIDDMEARLRKVPLDNLPRNVASRRLRLEALARLHRGDTDVAEALLNQALDQLGAEDAADERMHVHLTMARVAKSRGDILRAVRCARRALDQARSLHAPGPVVDATLVLASGFFRAARFRACRRALGRALNVARTAGNKLREAWVWRELGNLRLRQGDLAGAEGRYERALQMARALRARNDESACLHNLGITATLRGNYRAALSALRTALDIARAAGDGPGGAITSAELGHTCAYVGLTDEAETHLRFAYDYAERMHDRVLSAESGVLLRWIAATFQGSAAAVAGNVVAELDEPASRAFTLLYSCRAALASGQLDTADDLARALHAEVQKNKLRDFEAAALGLVGWVGWQLTGDTAHAATLTSALAIAQMQGLRQEEAELHRRLSVVFANSPRGLEHATQAMERIRELAEQLPSRLVAPYLAAPHCQAARRDFISAQRSMIQNRASDVCSV